ncbi:MAG: T9SS C-terminal target domain-containing protein [Saprospirales bacterium]|nr:MAG: T9SS C-terminal target domain-containing protein [Saprospirales bacterium]
MLRLTLLALIFSGLLPVGMLHGQSHLAPVYTVTTFQEAQPGSEGINVLDGDVNTVYHSRWGRVGIPDTLNAYFTDRVKSINRIVYVPRQSGLNGIWTRVDVYYSTRENPEDFFPLEENSFSWTADHEEKVIELSESIEQPAVIRFAVNSGFGNYSSCALLQFYSGEEIAPAHGYDCRIPTDELSAANELDLKAEIFIDGSWASSFQPGENIERSFDGNLNTLYHSSWSATTFPVTLNYRLDGETSVDYLRYTPRTSGSNGNFGNVEIYYNTAVDGPGSEFVHLMDYNFGQSGLPTVVDFPNAVEPLNIQLVVLDGAGGFASCAQMEFYTRVQQPGADFPYADIFSDELYAALQPEVTQTHIDTIRSDFYRTLAQCLFEGDYNLRYRMQSYGVYRTLASIREQLNIGNYNAFENPTGIVFDEGEKAALFVRNIPAGKAVFLRVRDFANEDNPVDRAYQLVNGLNLIEMENSGLSYISYFDDDLNLPEIEVHIVSGRVNGYFDLDFSDDQDWMDLLSSENYSKLDIRGKYTHLIYDKGALRYGSPFEGRRLVMMYDSIVNHQRLMMGMYKYPDRFVKNRQLSLSGFSGGWYAGGLGIHLDLSWGVNSITNPNQLGLWGIAHEFGHVNQIRPGITWHGTVEVTVNIYSTWVTYHMNYAGNPYTRLESEPVSFADGVAPLAGGRINAQIQDTYLNEKALKEAEPYDVFKVLVPFWQLQLYYQLAGAARNAPVLSFDEDSEDYGGVDYANFFGKIAKMASEMDLSGMSPGQLQLNFVKMVCDAVEEDLTDFFIHTGFLRPINTLIDDYGERPFVITQAEVDETIAYIQSKGYEKPVSPVLHYISAHSLNAFLYQLELMGENGRGVIHSGNTLIVDHDIWKNAVAFETWDDGENLLHISISGTGDPSNQSTTLAFPANAERVYAVGFDGQKMLVYPEETTSTLNLQVTNVLKISPNPIGDNEVLKIKLDNPRGNYQLELFTTDGRKLLTLQGNIEQINGHLQPLTNRLNSGVYLLRLRDVEGNFWESRFIRQ